MKRLIYIMTAVMVVFAVVLVDSAVAQRPVYRKSIRAMGMGNAYTALASGTSALSYNPAGLSKSDFNLEILALQGAINQRFIDVTNFVTDNLESFQDFESLSDDEASQFLDDMAPFDDRYIGLRVGPQIALTMFNFGISVYGDLKPDLRLGKGIYVPRISTKGYMDAVASLGYGRSFEVPGVKTLHAGVAAKYITRYEVSELRLQAQTVQNTDEFAETFLDTLPDPQNGMAFDIGFMFSPLTDLDVGVNIMDLGSVGGESLPMHFNIGGAYFISQVAELPVINSAIVTADIRDFFNSDGVSLFHRLHFGAEIGIPMVQVRTGLNQGYVTAGFGIDLFILTLDYAYFGQEMGDHLGWEPEFSHVLQLGIGL